MIGGSHPDRRMAMTATNSRATATERYLGWGRAASGASLLVALATDVLGGYAWFVAAVLAGGLLLLGLGLTTLVAPHLASRDARSGKAVRHADPVVFGLLLAAGPDEDVGYVVVLLILMMMLAALKSAAAYRAAVVIGVVAEVVRQALHPLIGATIDPVESVIGIGLAVGLSAALAGMVEVARTSEAEAVRSAEAAGAALAEAERAAAQLDVLHRVVVSTIGAREAEALQKMVAEVAEYLDVVAVSVVMLDEDERPRVTATTDPEIAARDDVAPITHGPFLEGPLARALAGEATRASPEELAQLAAVGLPALGDLGVHPLHRAGGTVVGALVCGTGTDHVLSPTEVRTIARFADQMSLAIEAARSLDREVELARRYQELDHLKTDFIAITSHELRTPLTTVLGVIETMRQRLGDLTPAELERLVGALARQAQRLSRLVDDLATVSRVDAGTLVTVRRPTDVVAVVRETAATLPEVHTAVHADGVVPLADADPDRLVQVLTNLVVNGDQHGHGTVHLAVHDAGPHVVVRVWDEGPGIPTDRRDDIFERFVRLGATDAHSRGTGLGLAIARELVVAMGGTIGIVDTEQGASAFELRFAPASSPA